MKKIFVLILAVAFFACIGIQAVYAKELKIGFADKLKILYEYKKTNELNKLLEKESIESKAKLEKMTEEIKKMSDDMELLSESAKKEKTPILEKKIQELNDFRRSKVQEMTRKQDDGLRKISEEITSICQRFGKAKGYDVIIDLRATLYPPDNMDLTDDILKDLNK